MATQVQTTNIPTQAYVVHAAKSDFVLEDVVLDGLRDDEYLVDMKYSGICHTDLVFQQGGIPVCPFPAIFGHEGAGTVRAIGSKVKDRGIRVGDFVLLSINFCEECRNCTAGHPADCIHGTRLHLHGVRPSDGSTAAKLKADGKDVRAHFFGQSSFMRTSFVQQTCVVKFPYSPEEAAIFAPMGCGYQTGAGTVLNILRPKPADSIVIFGLGTVGLTALMAAKHLGCDPIIAVDIQPSKLPLAKELGATHIVNSREHADMAAHLKALTPATNGVNFAVDCTGAPAVIEAMLAGLTQLGTAATVGVPPTGAKVSIDPLAFLLGSKRYVGCREGDSVPAEFIPKLVQMQRQGQFPVEKIVKVYDWRDFGKALEDLHHGSVVKPVIQWS